MTDQLTLSQPGGTHYPQSVLCALPDFQTLRRPCAMNRKCCCVKFSKQISPLVFWNIHKNWKKISWFIIEFLSQFEMNAEMDISKNQWKSTGPRGIDYWIWFIFLRSVYCKNLHNFSRLNLSALLKVITKTLQPPKNTTAWKQVKILKRPKKSSIWHQTVQNEQLWSWPLPPYMLTWSRLNCVVNTHTLKVYVWYSPKIMRLFRLLNPWNWFKLY